MAYWAVSVCWRDEERKRLAVLGATLGRKGLAALELTFSPETLLRWHHQLVALKYDGNSSYVKARPVTDAELVALVLRFSRENETWGYRLSPHQWRLGEFGP